MRQRDYIIDVLAYMRVRRSVIAHRLVFAVLFAAAAFARADVEVIALRFRTAEQVIPILQPLLEPGGSLSGARDQVIVRAGAANIAQLRKVIASIDRPLRRLVISVRQDALEAGAGAGGEFRPGSAGAGATRTRESGASARVYGSQAQRDERIEQQVQVLEGSRAVLQIGESAPVPAQTLARGPGGVIISQSETYRETSSGISVLPRLSGDRVSLEIAPWREVPGSLGSVDIQRLSTSAGGRLGEWIELGAIESSRSVRTTGLASSSDVQGTRVRRVWVKVEELP